MPGDDDTRSLDEKVSQLAITDPGPGPDPSTGPGTEFTTCLTKLKENDTTLTKDDIFKALTQFSTSYNNLRPETDKDFLTQFCTLLVAKEEARDRLVSYCLEYIKSSLKKKDKLEGDKRQFDIRLLFTLLQEFAPGQGQGQGQGQGSDIIRQFTINTTLTMSFIADPDLKILIILIVLKLKEIDNDILEYVMLEYLDDLVIMAQDDDQLSAVQLLTVVSCFNTMLSPFIINFIHSKSFFFNNLEINSKKLVSGGGEGDPMVVACLEFYSAFIMDEQIRNAFLSENYDILKTNFNKIEQIKLKKLTALCLTKYQSYVNDPKRKMDLKMLLEFFIAQDTIDDDQSIESLAYLSLQRNLQESLRSDVEMVDKLISCCGSTNSNSSSSVVFGVLTIITNLLGKSKDDEINQNDDLRTKLGKKLAAKQAAANNGQHEEDVEDDEQQIESFINYLTFDKQIIGHLIKLTKKNLETSLNLQHQLVKLISRITLYKQTRRELVKQSGLKFLLSFLVKEEEGTQAVEMTEIKAIAIRSLARILMSNDPNVVFAGGNTSWPAITCIPFLCELLNNDDGMGNDEIKFEILIALINLSSMVKEDDSDKIKNAIVKLSFDSKLQDLILSTNKNLQKASLELIANLSLSPSLLMKFFQIQEDTISTNNNNFDIMLKLANSTDIDIQTAAMNFFANLSELEPISLVIGHDNRFIELMMEFFNSDELLIAEEFIIRVCYTLMNVVVALCKHNKDDNDDDTLQKYKVDDLKNGILKLLQSSKDEELLQICINICNVIQFNK